MNDNLKRFTIQLIKNNQFSPELIGISDDVLSKLEQSVLVSSGDTETDGKITYEIYLRRKYNLDRQGITCAGLDETLLAIKFYNKPLHIISFANENYKIIALLNSDFNYVIGLFYMPISKETFNRIKK